MNTVCGGSTFCVKVQTFFPAVCTGSTAFSLNEKPFHWMNWYFLHGKKIDTEFYKACFILYKPFAIKTDW